MSSQQPSIQQDGPMRVREHRGWGHGLRPGEDRDINCHACAREDGFTRRASAEDIHLVIQDALSVYATRMKVEEASPVWAGPEYESARAWISERFTIAMALFEELGEVRPDVLKLTLTHGKDITL